MLFETSQEALKWYDDQERVLTPAFLGTIPWNEAKQHVLRPEFIPVLTYMRDIEKLTELYYAELLRTPTGKDPVIRRFMDRWGSEEVLHGDLLHRFLNEAGVPTSGKWLEEAKAKISKKYHVMSRLTTSITNLIGHQFSAVHMTWGAINELSTLTAYQQLAQLAKHPVLKYLLDAISREEARHSFFYWSIARIKLREVSFRQRLSRFIINKFWAPVGEGVKTTTESNYVITTLFSSPESVASFDRQVSRRINELPGFERFSRLTERIEEIGKA